MFKLLNVLQVMAFISPKIIGGTTAPTPVGELGMVEMTQALELSDVAFQQACLALPLPILYTSFWFEKESLYNVLVCE